MIHAFLLMVYLGSGDGRELISNDMYFQSIIECNFYAAELSRRYGNYKRIEELNPADRVTAYCVPRKVDPEIVRVY